MKYFLLLFFLFQTVLYPQKRATIDSIAYYTKLATDNEKENNYKEVLFYTQKSINYCKRNNKIEEEANQTFNLGKIYYDLKLHNDALEVFNKSIAIFNSISKKANNKVANVYYYIGLVCIEKKKYNLAETAILKAEEIKKKLNNKENVDLINLQKGILARKKGNNTLASFFFNSIAAKPETPL